MPNYREPTSDDALVVGLFLSAVRQATPEDVVALPVYVVDGMRWAEGRKFDAAPPYKKAADGDMEQVMRLVPVAIRWKSPHGSLLAWLTPRGEPPVPVVVAVDPRRISELEEMTQALDNCRVNRELAEMRVRLEAEAALAHAEAELSAATAEAEADAEALAAYDAWAEDTRRRAEGQAVAEDTQVNWGEI